jgi:hypothetical protein
MFQTRGIKSTNAGGAQGLGSLFDSSHPATGLATLTLRLMTQGFATRRFPDAPALSPDNPGRLAPATLGFLPGALPGRDAVPNGGAAKQEAALARSTLPANAAAMSSLFNGLPFGGAGPAPLPAPPAPSAPFAEANAASLQEPVAVVAPPPVIAPPPVVAPPPLVTPPAVVAPAPVVTPPAVVAPAPVVTPPAVVAPPPVVAPPMVADLVGPGPQLSAPPIFSPAPAAVLPVAEQPKPAPAFAGAADPNAALVEARPTAGLGPTGTIAPNAGLIANHVPAFLAAAGVEGAGQPNGAPVPAPGEGHSPWLKEVGAVSLPVPEYRPEPEPKPEPKRAEPKGASGNGLLIGVAVIVILGLAGAAFAFRQKLAGAFGGPEASDKPIQLDAPTADKRPAQPVSTSPTTTAEPTASASATATAVQRPQPLPVTQPTPGTGAKPPVQKHEPKFTPTEL